MRPNFGGVQKCTCCTGGLVEVRCYSYVQHIGCAHDTCCGEDVLMKLEASRAPSPRTSSGSWTTTGAATYTSATKRRLRPVTTAESGAASELPSTHLRSTLDLSSPELIKRAELGLKSQHRESKSCHLLLAALLICHHISFAEAAETGPGKPRVVIDPATMMVASYSPPNEHPTNEAKTCGEGL